jgi:hypothetical protein
MFRRIVAILFFAMNMTACNGGVPSRSEAEALIRRSLGDEHLYGYEKGDKGASVTQADFALDYVSGITNPDANTVRVEFMFHWVPTGEAAKKLVALGDKSPVSYSKCLGIPGSVWGDLTRWCAPISEKASGTAVFVKYDDGWRLQRVYV